MGESFAVLLGRHIQATHNTAGRLAALSGIPKRTIINWLQGDARKPRLWQDVVKLAAALNVTRKETDALLRAAQKPTIEALFRDASGEDRGLLTRWVTATASGAFNAPFQAKADLPYFVGRKSEMDRIRAALTNGDRVGLCSLHGMGGVGKTSLAIKIAYELRSHFTDGVLWASLGRSDTFAILGTFARALGEDLSQYPDVESRGAVVRSLIANRRVLIVLDDASKSEEVYPLLPPTTGRCALLLTTRHDLEVTDGWTRIPVEPFAAASGDSLALFAAFLNQSAVKRERKSLTKMADQVGHLPLAIALLAGQLAREPDISLPETLNRLYQSDTRLDALRREKRSVRLSFDLSYRSLAGDLQSFFTRLGAFGGDDFETEAAAYVSDLDEATAQGILSELQKRSLINVSREGRYRLHTLLREYAHEHLDEHESGSVWRRMVDFYTAYADLNSRDVQKVDLEYDNIAFVLSKAWGLRESTDMGAAYVKGCIALAYFWLIRGLYETAIQKLLQAQALAEQLGEQKEFINVLQWLGIFLSKQGKFGQADDCFLRSIELAETSRDDQLITTGCLRLGAAFLERGQSAQARRWLQHAREALLRISGGREQNEYDIFLNNMGASYMDEGNYEQAKRFYEESLERVRKRGGGTIPTIARLQNLGEVELKLGNYEQAQKLTQEGLALAKEVQARERIGGMSANLGSILAYRYGYSADAEEHYLEAISIACDLQQVRLVKENTRQWVAHHVDTGVSREVSLTDQALQAIEKVKNSSSPELIAILYFALAITEAAENRWDEARELAQSSLIRFETLQHPRVATLHAWLSGVNSR